MLAWKLCSVQWHVDYTARLANWRRGCGGGAHAAAMQWLWLEYTVPHTCHQSPRARSPGSARNRLAFVYRCLFGARLWPVVFLTAVSVPVHCPLSADLPCPCLLLGKSRCYLCPFWVSQKQTRFVYRYLFGARLWAVVFLHGRIRTPSTACHCPLPADLPVLPYPEFALRPMPPCFQSGIAQTLPIPLLTPPMSDPPGPLGSQISGKAQISGKSNIGSRDKASLPG